MKLVCGLGNPGPEYAATRHNVGWWLADVLRDAWSLPPARNYGALRASEGVVAGVAVLLIEPLTYMNRSGLVLAALREQRPFDPATELLVLVDDVALEPGRARLRASGSSGGHNGLKSVESALGTREYARLRVGVGAAPPDRDLADWVLSPFDEDEEAQVRALLPELVEGVSCWVRDGVVAAAGHCNR